MSQKNQSVELSLDVIVPDHEHGYLVDDSEAQATVLITRDTAATIMRMTESLIRVDARMMSSDVLTDIVAWPVEELAEALGVDLDEAEFTYAYINVFKTHFSFSIRTKLGSVETTEMDILELVRHFEFKVPWFDEGNEWRSDVSDYLVNLTQVGCSTLDEETEVYEAIVRELVKTAPIDTLTSLLPDSEKRKDDSEAAVFSIDRLNELDFENAETEQGTLSWGCEILNAAPPCKNVA